MAHVKAMELPEAANKRFFVSAGYFCNKELIEILRRNLPDYASKLPPSSAKGGEMPKELFKIDTQTADKTLGIKYKSLEDSITDTAKSLQNVGA